MESRRHNLKTSTRLSRSAELPADYTKVVRDVYATNFADGLKILKKIQGAKNSFEVRGAIFVDEIVLAVSLVTDGLLPATTIHCSVDFDPKASSPTAQDLLNLCVDAIGALFATMLDATKPETIEKLAAGTLAAFEEVPFEWAKVEFEGRRVYLLVDKSNPTLDEMTDRWLAENDPESSLEEEEYEDETKDLFVTGAKARKGSGSGSLH
jgi:hypothetical protein